MLSQMTPAEFQERMLADVFDPIDDSWMQSGTIAATVHNELWQIASMLAGERVVEKDLHSEQQYMPARVRTIDEQQDDSDDNERQTIATLNHLAAKVKARGNRQNQR